MKVYELMNELSKLPSGAEVKCSASLTTPELENCASCGDDEFENPLYSVIENLDFVSEQDGTVFLNF